MSSRLSTNVTEAYMREANTFQGISFGILRSLPVTSASQPIAQNKSPLPSFASSSRTIMISLACYKESEIRFSASA